MVVKPRYGHRRKGTGCNLLTREEVHAAYAVAAEETSHILVERYAAGVDRAVLFTTLAAHPGAATLLATIGGSSQVLADTLRRHPQLLAWLLEPAVMRQWPVDDLAAALTRTLAPFTTREKRANALRRFKYRQLLRIGALDLLGDADLAATTEELANLADACLAAAWRDPTS